MRPFAPFNRLARVWDYLLANTTATPKKSRGRLGVEALEARDVPAAVPEFGPNGGAWVLVDTLAVDVRDNDSAANGVESAVTLDAGRTYLAVARGTARIAPASDPDGVTDGEWIRYTQPGGGQDGSSAGYPDANHGVRLAGVAGGATVGNLWGAYQADHQYVREVAGEGAAVRGFYRDSPGYYADNAGTLYVACTRSGRSSPSSGSPTPPRAGRPAPSGSPGPGTPANL